MTLPVVNKGGSSAAATVASVNYVSFLFIILMSCKHYFMMWIFGFWIDLFYLCHDGLVYRKS